MSTSIGESVRDPIVIVGMHRSGTSMIARMLDELGVFMGWRLQGDHEPYFFLDLNNWLLEQCRCGWDNPGPIEYLLRNPDMRAAAIDYLDLSLHSPRVASFLGPRQYLTAGSPAQLDRNWGWKDPRTTFTLPLWLEFFPRARVIHVRRHGVDVASSLAVRHAKIAAQRHARFEKRKSLYRLISRRSRISTSVRVANLSDGFSLWEEYVDAGEAAIRSHTGPVTERRYEDFLADPTGVLGELADFCGLSVPKETVRAVAGEALPDRAFAYQRDAELRAFAERNADRLALRGY